MRRKQRSWTAWRRRRRFAGLFLAVILSGAVLAGASFSEDAHAATLTASYTAKHTGSNGGTQFTVPSLGLTGVCCQFGVKLKNGTATLTELPASSPYAKIAYYWGYQKGWEKAALGDAKRKHLTMLMQYATDPAKIKGFSYVKSGSCKKNYDTAMAASVPPGFLVYKANPSNASQDFVAWKWVGQARARVAKTSTDAQVMSAGYSFEGIRYGVYASQSLSASKLATLTLDKNSNSNVSGWLRLGTYYLTETDTNEWFEKNSTWYRLTLGQDGQTVTQKVSDNPKKAEIRIVKKIEDGQKTDETFQFTLRNTKYTNIVFSGLKVKGDGTPLSVKVPAGTYRLDEVIGEDAEYTDVSGTQTQAVAAGGTAVFTHVNRKTPKQMLKIIKNTDDGGSRAGFAFRVTGQLHNQGTLTSEALLKEAAPVVKLTEAEKYEFDQNAWKVNEEDLSALNRAAAERKNGTFEVRLTNRAKVKEGVNDPPENEPAQNDPPQNDSPQNDSSQNDAEQNDPTEPAGSDNSGREKTEEGSSPASADANEEPAGKSGQQTDQKSETDSSTEAGSAPEKTYEDFDIALICRVELQNVVFDPEENEYAAKTDGKKELTAEGEGWSATVSGFTWHGAATEYIDLDTGKNETILTTRANGCAYRTVAGKEEEGLCPAFAGEYTVEEVMTDAQKERYRQPEVQKKTMSGDKNATLTFTFSNKARRTPVRLIKTSEDGKVSGIRFRLTGKTAFGEEITENHTTNEKGEIDFGTISRGEYVIQETGFDRNAYVNTSPLAGYDRPAVRVKITGEEKEPVTVSFQNVPTARVLLSKVDGTTKKFLSGAVFSLRNLTKNREEARFRIIEKELTPEAEMIEKTENIRTADPSGAGEDAPEGFYCVMLTGLISGDEYEISEIEPPEGYGPGKAETFKAAYDKTPRIIIEDLPSAIGTLASDGVTDDHVSFADDTMTIVDEVKYENLVPGREYTVKGILMNRTRYMEQKKKESDEAESAQNAEESRSGETAVDSETSADDHIEPALDADGRKIEAEAVFTPDTPNGTVDVTFTFSGKHLAGSSLVVFETLYSGDREIVSHENPDNDEQSVDIPKLKTTAVSEDTKEHLAKAGEQTVINDTVVCSNLLPGREYTLIGTLMDKETGAAFAAEDVPVTAQKTFTAKNSDETVVLPFELNASLLAGTTAVVFEELRMEDHVVAEHKDINDLDQSVYLPGIGTTAERISSGVIRDTVEYHNLLPGKTYIMRGVLMDRETGSEIPGASGEKRFVADKPDGKVTIDFSIDAEKLKGKEVVAFEKCYYLTDEESGTNNSPDVPGETAANDAPEIEIAAHEDLQDEKQTVDLSEAPKTGYGMYGSAGCVAAVLTAAALAAAEGRRRRMRTGR